MQDGILGCFQTRKKQKIIYVKCSKKWNNYIMSIRFKFKEKKAHLSCKKLWNNLIKINNKNKCVIDTNNNEIYSNVRSN